MKTRPPQKRLPAAKAAEVLAASFAAEIGDVAKGHISVFVDDNCDESRLVAKVHPERLIKLVANELMIMGICMEEGIPLDSKKAGTTNPGVALCYE